MTQQPTDETKTPVKRTPEIILDKPTRPRGRKAWITEGNNDLGLRDTENTPITIPSPSPGAYRG